MMCFFGVSDILNLITIELLNQVLDLLKEKYFDVNQEVFYNRPQCLKVQISWKKLYEVHLQNLTFVNLKKKLFEQTFRIKVIQTSFRAIIFFCLFTLEKVQTNDNLIHFSRTFILLSPVYYLKFSMLIFRCTDLHRVLSFKWLAFLESFFWSETLWRLKYDSSNSKCGKNLRCQS